MGDLPVKKTQRKSNLPPGPGPGRPKGLPNKATANAREAVARLVDNNSERLQEWLDQIALTDGPKAAYQCLLDILEYHVPKLSRVENTGKDGAEPTLRIILDRNE